jgi:hypothetical protein
LGEGSGSKERIVDIRKNKLSFGSSEVLTVVAVILTLVSGSWGAAKEKVIHYFQYIKGEIPTPDWFSTGKAISMAPHFKAGLTDVAPPLNSHLRVEAGRKLCFITSTMPRTRPTLIAD